MGHWTQGGNRRREGALADQAGNGHDRGDTRRGEGARSMAKGSEGRYVASGKKKGCVTEWMAMPAGGRGHQSGTASGGNGPTEGTVGAGSACGRRSDRGRRLEGGDQRQWLSRSVTEHRKREGVCTIVNGRMSPAGWRGCPPAAAPRLPRRETCVGSNPLSSTSAF
jgi:hypothetical protein